MIVLASTSPRRKEILSRYFKDFKIVEPTFDESTYECDDPFDCARDLAYLKAESVAKDYFEDIVIGCDTVVSIDDEILRKPKNYEDAFRMIKKLSGRQHYVISGLGVIHKALHVQRITWTTVYFNELSDEQIKNWLNKNTYLDKAGAYAIQDDEFGFVKEIKGSYDNVMGLPSETLLEILASFGYFPNKEL